MNMVYRRMYLSMEIKFIMAISNFCRTDIEVKQERVSDNEDMRIVDDVDNSQIEEDNESNFSHASSFSHTFSRSRSLTGSFTATFSDSLSLSSFTGSNATLGLLKNLDSSREFPS